jgi:hypothetical protein
MLPSLGNRVKTHGAAWRACNEYRACTLYTATCPGCDALKVCPTRGKRPGTHRFQRAGINQKSFGNKRANRHVRTLEAMRTRALSEEPL